MRARVILLEPCSVHADLVVAILRDVAHPGQGLVAALLHDLEVADLHARDREVGNLELDLNWDATVLLALFRLDRGEAELGAHEELLAACELLDAPDHRVGVGDVLDIAHVGLENWGVNIRRDRHNDLDIVRNRLRLELSLRLHEVLDLGPGKVLDHAVGPDQGLDVRVQTVGHQVELTVRRDKRDVALLFELVEAHALVELDVLHLDQFATGRAVLHLEEHLVVEAELQLRHAAQIAAHVNAPKDLRPEHVSIGADQDVEPLDHIQEDLVLGVLDSLRTPRDDIGGGSGHHDIS